MWPFGGCARLVRAVFPYLSKLRDPQVLGRAISEACPLWSRTRKQADCSSTDQGGGKRRPAISRHNKTSEQDNRYD
jgi:hypothetical protein